MLKKIFVLLLLIVKTYADLLNISKEYIDIYNQIIGKWNIVYEAENELLNFDANVSNPYFHDKADGFVVNFYENSTNTYICSYNLAFESKKFTKFSEFICIKKDDYENNHEVKSFITFSINENENTLIGRMGVLVETKETYSYSITGTKSEITPQKKELKLKLKKGWNLISIPVDAKLIPIMEEIPALDGELIYTLDNFGKYEEIFTYNNDEWSKNPTSIFKEEGFWIKLNENSRNISFEGNGYLPNLITLKSGWHLMGTGSTIIDPLSLSTTEHQIEVIWKYKDEWIKNPEVIEAGEGFWIKKTINY